MYGKCLNIRNVLKHGAWNGLYIWFVRRYSWLSISMHRVCRQMAHIMLFNSFVWCVWWVLRSELEVMFGHSEKFSKSQRPSSNMTWLWRNYNIYRMAQWISIWLWPGSPEFNSHRSFIFYFMCKYVNILICKSQFYR